MLVYQELFHLFALAAMHDVLSKTDADREVLLVLKKAAVSPLQQHQQSIKVAVFVTVAFAAS